MCVCLRSLLNSSVEHAMRITVTCVHAMVQTIEFGVFIFLITVHGNQTVMLSSVVQRKNWIEKYYHHHHQWENEHCFICCVWILLAHTLRSVRVKVSRCVTVVICCRLRRRRHFAVLIIHAQQNEPHSTFGFRIHACAHIWQAVRQHTQTKMSKTFTISSHWKKLLRTWFSYGF